MSAAVVAENAAEGPLYDMSLTGIKALLRTNSRREHPTGTLRSYGALHSGDQDYRAPGEAGKVLGRPGPAIVSPHR